MIGNIYFAPISRNGMQRFVEAGQPAGWYQLDQADPDVNVLPGIVVPDGITGMLVQANTPITYCFSPADAPSSALTLQAGGTLTISGRKSVLLFCIRLSGAGANVTFQFLTGNIGPAFTTS